MIILALMPILLFSNAEGQYRSPEITEHPADLLVPRNEPATLNCHAEGRPKPKISWYKDGKKFDEGIRHIVLENGDLFFLRVLQTKKENDSGIYWCQAENEVGMVRSKNATLEIAVLRDDFRVEPEDTQVAEGSTALLNCVPPKGHPEPAIVWTKDDVVIDPATEHRYKLVDQGSLAIKGVRVSDSGLYVCKARNVYATKETTPAYLTVLVPPHLVSFTDIVTGAAGGTLEMVCRVGGDPRPEVFWERVSPGELPVERMTQEESGQVLRIRHATPEDQGQYVCKAENPVGAVKANITLKVHSHPVISKMPENARVALKGVAVFECEASGSPLPTSYWTVEGKGDILEPSQSWDNGRITVDEHNTLTIKEVTSKDAGYYVCAAVGIAGSAIARAHLEVLDPSDMPPPIIALGAPNQTLPLGTEGEMPCDARGTPEPKVQWYIGNKLFEPSKRASVSPLGTLRITNLQMSDTATYVCKATSLSGTSVWTTTLTVAKPTNPNVAFFKMPNEGALPEPPGNVMVQLINSTSLTLGWRRGRSGSSSVLGYTVQMWSPDLKGQWTTATTKPAPSAAMPVSVIVTGLKPNTRYIFTVRASNSHGLSRPSDTTHIVRTLMAGTKGELPLSQVRTRLSSAAIRLVSLKAVSAVALQVNMTLLAEPSIIEGIHIRYRSVDERKTNNNPYGALNMETIKLGKDTHDKISHTIVGLRQGTTYETFVAPFYRIVEGQPSAAMRATTLEAPPAVAPTGLHQSFVNKTTVRLAWDPIPEHTSNGHITSYYLQVIDVTNDNRVHLNTSIEGTWTLVSKLLPGTAYHATIRGVSSSGTGPVSLPIAFSVGNDNLPVPLGPTGGTSIPSSNVENNNYLILIIVSAALILFGSLLVSVFLIYRKRKNNKCPTYLSKAFTFHTVDEKDVWTDYPRSWNDTSKSFCMTSSLYTETGSQAATMSQFFQHSSEVSGKEADAAFDERQPDNLYEDPDGLRLVSFAERPGQRCISPAPYATTTLISNNSSDLLNRLPPNIPIQDILIGTKESEAMEALQCLQAADHANLQAYNFNSNFVKDTSRPLLQMSETSVAEDENSKNLALSTFNPEFTAAYLMQQQQQQDQQQLPITPFSFSDTNSSSLVNIRPQGSSTFGRPYNPPKNASIGSQSPLIIPSFTNPKTYESFSNNHENFAHISNTATLRTRKAQQQQVLQEIKDLCWKANESVEHNRRLSEGKANHSEFHSQPLLGGKFSPRSSTFGDSEGSDCEEGSTSSCSSRPQVTISAQNGSIFPHDKSSEWKDTQSDTFDISAFDSGISGISNTKNRKTKTSENLVSTGRNSFSIAMSSPLI